jgi:uncharacterized RDD family membrane protein YckC
VSSARASRLEVVEEAAPPPSPPPVTDSLPKTAAIFGALQAIAMLLAIRFLLLVVLAGAIGLGVMAMERESTPSLILLAIYGCLIVAPMVWLERTNRR